MKRCSRCGEGKLPEQFKLDKRRSDGRSSHCRRCHNEESQARYWSNPERVKRLEIEQDRQLRNVKRCSKCEKEKAYLEFRTKNGRDGYRNDCRECERAGHHARYWANLEKSRRKVREDARKHRKKYPDAFRQYYFNNHEKLKEQARRWGTKNKDKKYKTTKVWRIANREYVNAYMRNLYQEKPEMFLKRDVKRRAQKRTVRFEPVSLKAILAKHGMICHLCGKRLKKNELTFDHLIPLNRGGPHAQWNLAPAHRTCNSRKGDRVVTPAQPPLFS
jgi:5-methylcytosine-specific restriction endonuclease McrA